MKNTFTYVAIISLVDYETTCGKNTTFQQAIMRSNGRLHVCHLLWLLFRDPNGSSHSRRTQKYPGEIIKANGLPLGAPELDVENLYHAD
eukprot:scaffold88319_cov31-Attheya_sp.AAC.1